MMTSPRKTFGAPEMYSGFFGSKVCVLHSGLPVLAFTPISRPSIVAMINLPSQNATPRLESHMIRSRSGPAFLMVSGSYSQSSLPLRASTARVLFQLPAKYMTPSTTSGVPSNVRSSGSGMDQARPSFPTLSVFTWSSGL